MPARKHFCGYNSTSYLEYNWIYTLSHFHFTGNLHQELQSQRKQESEVTYHRADDTPVKPRKKKVQHLAQLLTIFATELLLERIKKFYRKSIFKINQAKCGKY